VELGGATQGLARTHAATAFLCVMHEEHGEFVPSLQLAQVSQQGRDFSAGVFVDAM